MFGWFGDVWGCLMIDFQKYNELQYKGAFVSGAKLCQALKRRGGLVTNIQRIA